MNTAQLVKMANQVGAFFEAMPDAAQGVAGTAEHLQKFWEPRMRKDLLQYLSVAGDGELKPIVRAALKTIEVEAYREG